MFTNFVTLIQSTERDAARAHRLHSGRFVARERPIRAAGRVAVQLLRRVAGQGFRSARTVSSVSMPDVDYRAARSSSR